MLAPVEPFAQHGNSGAWVSRFMPFTAKMADDLCFIKSMHTDAVNHAPAISFLLSGAQIPGRPTLGAWLTYGLGAFTLWMAGGGTRSGFSYGESDDLAFNVATNPVHVHDFQATLLHLMGIDHERLTYRFQGRDFRLTDVHGTVVQDVIA